MKKKRNVTKEHKGELLKVLQVASVDKHLLDAFLGDLLTPSEYQDLVLRWQIVKQLTDGIPQRTIAKNLKVGIATVTRGSRELSDKKGGFLSILEQKLSEKSVAKQI